MIYQTLIAPLLFALDPETAHNIVLSLLSVLSKDPSAVTGLKRIFAVPPKPVKVFGLNFPNPIGLAAGFDKNGVAVPALAALGFGFVEVGSVTQHAQSGNPRPRLFRLKRDRGIINRMGFNNHGSYRLAKQLAAHPKVHIPIGVNLGKSKITPLDQAESDYYFSLVSTHAHADYIVINVSSPNTQGLRDLQEKQKLSDLLLTLKSHMQQLSKAKQKRPIPLLVKIAPDLSWPQLDDVLEVCSHLHMDGIIATNTTLRRDGLFWKGQEQGGLSGEPLRARALEIVSYIAKKLPSLPIIGVGGISHPDHVKAMMDAGASLVQLYTGLIYEGPFLIQKLVRALP